MFISHSYLIILLPLLGFMISGLQALICKTPSKSTVNIASCGAIIASFAIAVGIFIELSMKPVEGRSITLDLFEWMTVGIFKLRIAFLIDQLTAVMALIITGIGSLIHLYSVRYMRNDASYARFFSYLNLFCFAMLILVFADSLPLMFVGWEGVGLCSYLLIGFWYENKANASAGMKAFIVNRVGDLGFVIGMMILFTATTNASMPTLSFVGLHGAADLISNMRFMGLPVIPFACLALFVGACGKSAQIPLYVWLPDAMAGPTPVSALIHAATMVTAGVYMVARMGFLYTMSPMALEVIAITGAATALFAATIGFGQDDIKKVLAYSTVSQLGMMFIGMGTGVYSAGIFHLMTHAFFKACLFLAAGSVILAMHHEQDIKKMGGLRKFIPITHWTFLIAMLALSGLFPFAGFFSKDEILWRAFELGMSGDKIYTVVWAAGLLAAFCTAFYMMRLYVLVFLGEHHIPTHNDEHGSVPNDRSSIIRFVLIMLAIPSAIAGLLGIPAVIGGTSSITNIMERWLEPVFSHGVHHKAAYGAHNSLEYILMAVSLSVALLGFASAYYLYTVKPSLLVGFASRFKFICRLVRNKYFIDELYAATILKIFSALVWISAKFDTLVVDAMVNLSATISVISSKISGWFDTIFVDGAVNGVSSITTNAGSAMRRIQTGKIQHYLYIAAIGLLAIIAWRCI